MDSTDRAILGAVVADRRATLQQLAEACTWGPAPRASAYDASNAR